MGLVVAPVPLSSLWLSIAIALDCTATLRNEFRVTATTCCAEKSLPAVAGLSTQGDNAGLALY